MSRCGPVSCWLEAGDGWGPNRQCSSATRPRPDRLLAQQGSSFATHPGRPLHAEQQVTTRGHTGFMENVDVGRIVRGAIQEFNERDVESFARRFAEGAQWWPLRSDTEGPYTGPAGVRDWFRESGELFDYIRAELDDFDSRGDMTIATGQLKLRGKGSGVTVDLPITWAFRLAREKIVWARAYAERDAARADIAAK